MRKFKVVLIGILILIACFGIYKLSSNYLSSDSVEATGSSAVSKTEKQKSNSKKVIVIDAGHQKKANLKLEPIGPGSKTKKYKVAGGAKGRYTGQYEYSLNLKVSKLLCSKLKKLGYTVVMIRTSNDVNISNSQRAKIANKNNADVFIRIHANSDKLTSANGVMTLCQTKNNPYISNMYKKSLKLSKSILNNVVKYTGAKNLGVKKTDTMTGINWSNVPTTILEMGFLSNKKEDKLLATSGYQKKVVSGIVKGIEEYLK